MHTRPADAADENETAGQEGYSETFHTFTSMNKELERYIEREIIPRYEDFDAAHRTDHVRTVIAQSLELAAHYDADADMVYTVAAYHDTGLANGRELRVIVGADKLSDQESEGLSHDIAKKIQDEMTYPGQVKITVIRETRAVSYAK